MNILVILYIGFGILTLLIDWHVNHSKLYKELKEKNMSDDSMACIYMLYVMSFWPIKLLIDIFFKVRNRYFK